MKINRYKKIQKYLQFYSINFNFHEPYLIIIDGTFCNAALKNKIRIQEQLSRYFQAQIKIIVTACIITECDKLGAAVQGATQILKRFQVYQCGHEKSPITGAACMKSMTKKCNYVIATQDRDLQNWIRTHYGIPLLYLHNGITPILEEPSIVSKNYAEDKQQSNLAIRNIDEEMLSKLKKKEGLATETEVTKKKRRKKKNPNPLSCKKKKPKLSQLGKSSEESIQNKTIEKKKRKRIKLAKHVIEHLKNKQTRD
uniref:rRNA-processing protein UTP23 homolog n=1 Tax=Corethrella appendiculata TaxID=1370023 RepID=U5EVD5_9DIPT